MQLRQKAYLEAMGVPVWELRDKANPELPVQPVQLGPGSGQVLLLGADPGESAGKLASDVARSLRCEPVWGWPGGDESGATLDESIAERLFTHIVVFGGEVEVAVFGGPATELVGSAVVVRAAAMQEIKQSAAERRKLWASLCQHRLAGPRNTPGGS